MWAILFIVALGMRVAVAYGNPAHFLGDQRIYLTLAESMGDGAGYMWQGAPQVTVHPLLPVLHAAALPLFADGRTAGVAVSVLIGALLPLVGGLTVAMIVGFRPGYVAGALLAFQPDHLLRSVYIEPDLLAALLCFWLAALLWRGSHALAGAVLGLAYLNRPEMFVLWPFVVAIAWWRGAAKSRIVLLTVVFLALAGIFVLYVHADTGRWALSGKDRWQYLLGVHQWRSGNQPLDPADVDRLTQEISSPLAHIHEHPGEFALGYLYRWGLVLRAFARQLGWVLIPFCIYGAIEAWRSSRVGLALLMLPLYLLPVLAFVGTFRRHTFVGGAILVALSGIGLVAAWRAWERRRGA